MYVNISKKLTSPIEPHWQGNNLDIRSFLPLRDGSLGVHTTFVLPNKFEPIQLQWREYHMTVLMRVCKLILT